MILTITQGIIFVSYITFLLFKFKKPLSSISDSWYMLSGNTKHLFTFFCWGIGILMFFQTNDQYPFTFFLSGAGLSFVGAAAMFKSDDGMTGKIHSLGAAVGIIYAFLGIFLERHLLYPFIVWISIVVLLKIFKIKNYTWWLEIAAFLLIISGLMIKN